MYEHLCKVCSKNKVNFQISRSMYCIVAYCVFKRFFCIFFYFLKWMHNISRILCQNFKSIGAKLTKLRSIWASAAPGRVSIQVYKLRISRGKLQSVFLKLGIFEVRVHDNSKYTGPIVLKFCTVLLHIIHQVTLGASLFFLSINYFTITN